ncbi:MAG: DUF1917 domain-containing protein [Methanocalculus sp.]|uniref:putative phosphothreonine lyase domain-containing protein n=1 Tax=Methanocalculus sp. TaxID=2004547 RepID=UPI002721F225|nr:putative phosphothreonine lyase domain-containg protein [Methanocalculus sp.]MDO9539670.1 DUF1917 domain-containing protein [Methanocalculus sp.]
MDTPEPDNTNALAGISFGIFTIYFAKSMEQQEKPFFQLIDRVDELNAACQSTFERFREEYPPLAEAIISDVGEHEEICRLYQNGEGIIPTKTERMHWIIQDAPGIDPDAVNSEDAGKWLIFLPRETTDEIWVKIRDETWAGNLGISAKVSTAKENPSSRDDRLVIYVYTGNWRDEEEVMRIREVIRTCGITDRIGYKRNLETFAGEYSSFGKRVTYYNA